MTGPLVDAAALARWLGYAALFALIGAGAIRPLVSRALGRSSPLTWPILRRAAALGAGAAVLLLLSLAIRLYDQGRDFADEGAPVTAELLRPIVEATDWGAGWRWQVGAALVALVGFVAARRFGLGWPVATLGALGSAVAAPLTGHALEHPWGRLGTALQVVHVGFGGLWLGTLLILAATAYPATRGMPDERETALAALVGRYSPIALTAGIITIGVGLLLGWTYLGGIAPLFATGYGRVLLVKIGLLAGVAALGAWNWRRVRPALGSAPGAGRLRMSATAELVLGTLLLGATAILVALPAPAL